MRPVSYDFRKTGTVIVSDLQVTLEFLKVFSGYFQLTVVIQVTFRNSPNFHCAKELP